MLLLNNNNLADAKASNTVLTITIKLTQSALGLNCAAGMELVLLNPKAGQDTQETFKWSVVTTKTGCHETWLCFRYSADGRDNDLLSSCKITTL